MKNSGDRYQPQRRKIGILHPLEGEQRQFLPRGYQIDMGETGQHWESITEVEGVLLPYEIRPRPHVNVRGEKGLLIVPFEDKVCYAIGPLTVGGTVRGWRKNEVTADFFVAQEHLAPYPFDDKPAEERMRPFLEHSMLVRNVVIDMAYADPWEYNYELCA